MLNRHLTHFITIARGQSKLDIIYEILLIHMKKNSIDLHKNLTN